MPVIIRLDSTGQRLRRLSVVTSSRSKTRTGTERGREDARAPEERRREDGRNEPGGGSRLDGVNRRRAASLGPTFRRADRRPRPRGRRKLSERPASEAQPARPSAVLAPSRVQRRGVQARRAARALRGRRSRNGGRAGGNVPSGAPAPRGTAGKITGFHFPRRLAYSASK